MPSSSMLGISPLNDHNEDYCSDNEKSTDTTNHSALSKLSKEPSIVAPKKKPLVVNGVTVDDYMYSDNLNECVDFLLRKQKIQNLNVKAIIRHNSSAKSKEKRRRMRKNKDQHLILLA